MSRPGAPRRRRAANDPQPGSHDHYQVHVAMLIDDPNTYAIVGRGLGGARYIQLKPNFL